MSTTSQYHPKTYDDGRTKQAFKDSTDINKILVQAAKGDSISHIAQHGAVYGDFSDIDDLLTGYARLESMFGSLPLRFLLVCSRIMYPILRMLLSTCFPLARLLLLVRYLVLSECCCVVDVEESIDD